MRDPLSTHDRPDLTPFTDHVPQEHRTLVAVEHLAPLAAFWLPGVGAVIGALVAWLLTRDRHPILDDQGKEVVNFQISLVLYSVAVSIPVVLTLGLGFLLLWPVFVALYALQFVAMILAVSATLGGRPYRYPFTLRFLR